FLSPHKSGRRHQDAPFVFCNRSVVNACQPTAHQSFIVELPQFVAVRKIPMPVKMKVQTCEQFTQAHTYRLESDPPESPALYTYHIASVGRKRTVRSKFSM